MDVPDYREMMVSAAKKQRFYLLVIAVIVLLVVLAGIGTYFTAQQYAFGCLSLCGAIVWISVIIACFLVVVTPCCKTALKIKTGVEEVQNDN